MPSCWNASQLDPTKKGRTYSKGNRQKVALVAALASDAELLILDEPTSGLDPLMEAVFTETVLEAKNEGRTVLLSSHILAEVEKLCDRVSIIRTGKTVQTGSLAELRQLTRTTVRATTDHPTDGIGNVPGVHDLRIEDTSIQFDVDGDHLGAALSELARYGVRALTSAPVFSRAVVNRVCWPEWPGHWSERPGDGVSPRPADSVGGEASPSASLADAHHTMERLHLPSALA